MMSDLGGMHFTCFQIKEENKWKLKEISGRFKMEESQVVNLMIENLHSTLIGNPQETGKSTRRLAEVEQKSEEVKG